MPKRALPTPFPQAELEQIAALASQQLLTAEEAPLLIDALARFTTEDLLSAENSGQAAEGVGKVGMTREGGR